MRRNETLAYRYQHVNYPVKYICRGKGRKDFKEESDKVYMLVAIVGKNRELKCHAVQLLWKANFTES